MRSLEKRWYATTPDWLSLSLLPLSFLFRAAVGARRFLYSRDLKKRYSFSVPVIVVGNITLGGTGKTPFVIWLAELLKSQGFKPGIVSRGVGGRKHRQPLHVTSHHQPEDVGDEAILLSRRTQCPVFVGIRRPAVIKSLLANTDCNIVISDDGLQHYAMARDIEIAIVDGERGFGNAKLLPAGPLRESLDRLQEVDFVVQNAAHKSLPYSLMQLQGDTLVAVQNGQQQIALSHFSGKRVHAVAAIGHPQRFFKTLRQAGLELIEHVFPDHYLYNATDFNFNDELPIIMTEKDAVKCEPFANERFWFVPVKAEVEEEFAVSLLQKIKELKKALSPVQKEAAS